MFELWDTRNARLVGRFASESEALDAAYRALRAEGLDRPHLAVSQHLAVSRGGESPSSGSPRRWMRIPGALRGLSLRLV